MTNQTKPELIRSGPTRIDIAAAETKYGKDFGAFKVQHQGETLYFSHNILGPHSYEDMLEKFKSESLRAPSLGQIASLMEVVLKNSEDENESRLLSQLRVRKLLVFNKQIWSPEGIYIIDDAEGILPSKYFSSEIKELIQEKLITGKEEAGVKFSQDRNARFVPYDNITLGEHTSHELSKNTYLIGLADIEGAEKLAKASEKHNLGAFIHGYMNLKFKNFEQGKVCLFGFGYMNDYLSIHDSLPYQMSDYSIGFSKSPVHFAHETKKRSLTSKIGNWISVRKS